MPNGRLHATSRELGAAGICALALLASSGCGSAARTGHRASMNDSSASPISWPRARTLLRHCQAKAVEQTHNRLVLLTLSS